jgi:hypothetical protein
MLAPNKSGPGSVFKIGDGIRLSGRQLRRGLVLGILGRAARAEVSVSVTEQRSTMAPLTGGHTPREGHDPKLARYGVRARKVYPRWSEPDNGCSG